MANVSLMGANFPPEVVNQVFNLVSGHSALAKLAGTVPLAQAGSDLFTFTMDGEANIVGEGESSTPGDATATPVTMHGVRVEYIHRLSDEFLQASEERQLEMIKALTEGMAMKIARAQDIMAMHGVNPATGTASDKIGSNHLDTCGSVELGTDPEEALEDAIGKLGAGYRVTGYAMSQTFASKLGKMKVNGVSQYPEFKLGGRPGVLGGNTCDVNDTVDFKENTAEVYLGDFARCFKWGYCNEVPVKIFTSGDPDGLGDLARKHQIAIRAEATIGWAILDKNAFKRVIDAV